MQKCELTINWLTNNSINHCAVLALSGTRERFGSRVNTMIFIVLESN